MKTLKESLFDSDLAEKNPIDKILNDMFDRKVLDKLYKEHPSDCRNILANWIQTLWDNAKHYTKPQILKRDEDLKDCFIIVKRNNIVENYPEKCFLIHNNGYKVKKYGLTQWCVWHEEECYGWDNGADWVTNIGDIYKSYKSGVELGIIDNKHICKKLEQGIEKYKPMLTTCSSCFH